MIKSIANLEGLGPIVQSDGDLYTNVKDLKDGFISVRDEALLRIMTAGKENIGAIEGTRTAVKLGYIKNDAPVALKYDKLSPAIAKRAVEANSKGKYLCTNSTEMYDTNRRIADREEYSEIPYKNRRAIVLPREDFNMSPSENSSKFAFFFEDMSGDNSYFAFNKKFPISVYLINKDIIDGKKDSGILENPDGTIIVPYMWFRSLESRSGLDGDDGDASYCNDGTRGVFGAPLVRPKISKAGVPHTSKYMSRYALKVQGVIDALRSGKIDVSKLEAELAEVSEFLEIEQ